MRRAVLKLALLAAAAIPVSGCGFCMPLGPWGGPAYTLDTDRIGTGRPAIVPLNDAVTWDGQPMDLRTRR